MNINSSGNNHHLKSNCLYNKLTKSRKHEKKLEIDLNLPASSNETEEVSTHNVHNSDDEALSQYASESSGALSGRPHNDDSTHKDASRKKKSNSSSIVKWKQQVKVSLEIGLEVPPNDGYMWRKYGQKEILNAKYPREYYRCTYRNTHGCCATKQVQRSSDDSSIFEITYLGKHTCPKISKTNHHSSTTESGYGLINFSSTPKTVSTTSKSSDPSATQSSSSITRNSFELSNWPMNHHQY